MHRPASLKPLALALAISLVATGCTRSSSHEGPPIYDESEINDLAAEANYFGVLRPGDHFIIRGDISDIPCDPFDPFAYCDPFDGFAFTAGEPIHVEFRLFMDRASHDFDVCLYDPLLGLTIDCFQSPNNPELGGVDVFAGGLDFHLVVESFFGTGGYDLEIEVYGLYESGLEGPEASGAAPAQGLAKRAELGSAAREDADPSSFDAYGAQADEQAEVDAQPPLGEIILVDVDPETGAIADAVFLVLADGTLVPKE